MKALNANPARAHSPALDSQVAYTYEEEGRWMP